MVEFAGNGTELIAGGFLKIWDINNTSNPAFKSIEQGMEFANATVVNADISPDGKYIAAVSTMRIDVYEIQSRAIVKTFRGIGLAGVAFGPDNQLAYISVNNNSLVIHDIPKNTQTLEKKFNGLKPLRVAWSPSGKYIAMGGRGDIVTLFDIDNNSIVGNTEVGRKWVSDLEFSPDNKYLAISQQSGIVRIIESSSGNELKNWTAHSGGTFALAFHPNGKFLATGGDNNMINVWSVPAWEGVTAWPAHDKAVRALCFSADGQMMASGSNSAIAGNTSDTRIWTLDGIIETEIIAERIQTDQPENNVSNPVFIKPVESNLQAANPANQKRLALLIGNGMYQNGGILANPENDANDIGKSLQNLGFDVMLYNNLDQKGFRVAIDEFGTRLSDYDVGLFYYAGHGIQVKGNNYLIPVDANLKSENDVEYDCVNAGRLLAKMEDAGSKTNIIILDACRDNPFERSWRRSTHGLGLAFMTAPAGSLISYATSPGATASDGSGRNGLYTTALLEYIHQPNLSLMEMFQRVRTYVRQNSDGQQVPWESTSLEGNFYFSLER